MNDILAQLQKRSRLLQEFQRSQANSSVFGIEDNFRPAQGDPGEAQGLALLEKFARMPLRPQAKAADDATAPSPSAASAPVGGLTQPSLGGAIQDYLKRLLASL